MTQTPPMGGFGSRAPRPPGIAEKLGGRSALQARARDGEGNPRARLLTVYGDDEAQSNKGWKQPRDLDTQRVCT